MCENGLFSRHYAETTSWGRQQAGAERAGAERAATTSPAQRLPVVSSRGLRGRKMVGEAMPQMTMGGDEVSEANGVPPKVAASQPGAVML